MPHLGRVVFVVAERPRQSPKPDFEDPMKTCSPLQIMAGHHSSNKLGSHRPNHRDGQCLPQAHSVAYVPDGSCYGPTLVAVDGDPGSLKYINSPGMDAHAAPEDTPYARVLAALARDPTLVAIAEQLLGEKVGEGRVEYFNKPPKTSKLTPPHQDVRPL